MKLKIPGGHMTIDDQSEEAKKIRQGYDHVFENGQITIGEKKHFDQEAFRKKLETKKATIKDIQEFLLTLLP